MIARNGNTLTFSDAWASPGNTGKTVSFTRDPAGHITAIKDPRGQLAKVRLRRQRQPDLGHRSSRPAAVYFTIRIIRIISLTAVDVLGVQQLHVNLRYHWPSAQLTDAKQNSINCL